MNQVDSRTQNRLSHYAYLFLADPNGYSYPEINIRGLLRNAYKCTDKEIDVFFLILESTDPKAATKLDITEILDGVFDTLKS